VIAFGRQAWPPAAREFESAREAGWGPIPGRAEYGLAAVAFNEGRRDEFKKIAAGLLARPADPATTPYLLRGVEAAAVADKQWAEARAATRRLLDQFPRHEVTPAALAEVGTAAGEAGDWRLAREMFDVLQASYPSAPGREASRVAYAETLLRSGDAPAARRELEALAGTMRPADPNRGRVLRLLGEAQEATGDRAAAAEYYARFAAENPGAKDAPSVDLGAGRLLQADGKWSEARPLLERAVKSGEGATAAEAAYRMGEGLRTAGEHDAAVESYMTAVYVAPDSVWGRRALLGAGRSLTALKQNDAAVIVYRKLLAASPVEPDLETAARAGLKALGVSN